MKAIIFAGGLGTRLWPLSRRSSPKQFEKVIGDKSTLQLAVERLQPDISLQDIYIFTASRYVDRVKKQLPNINSNHIFGEPEMRDVGPAVGLSAAIFSKEKNKEPMAILWSDHLVGRAKLFREILKKAEAEVRKQPAKIIFIGQKPRFASQNLGWIEYGEEVKKKDDIVFHRFKGFHYRPKLDQAKKFYRDGSYVWNIGYFVTTPYFLWQQYKIHAPSLYHGLEKIKKAYKTPRFKKVLDSVYPKLEKVNFDNLILEKLDTNDGLVVTQDIKWSDVGAWEALKEALQKHPGQNVIQGRVLTTDCRDSLMYNYTDQMTVTIDLDGILVINTHDVLLICHKNSVPKIKSLVEKLSGTENEHLI